MNPRIWIARVGAVGLLLAGAPPAGAQPRTTLPAQDRALAGRSEAVFAVGREEGADWETFNGVAQVAFDRDDNLYVLDAGNQRVLVFDRTGRFVRRIGRGGSGPGELRRPSGLAITSEGRIVVLDVGRPALEVYERDGRHLQGVPLNTDQGIPRRLQADAQGGVVVEMMALLSAGPQAPPFFVRHTLGSRPAATRLLVIPEPDERASRVEAQSAGPIQVVSASRPAFAPELLWAVTPAGYVAVANSAAYDVRLLGANGSLHRRLTRALEPRRVTRQDRTAELENRRERLQTRSDLPPPARRVLEQQLETLTFAEVVPVIRALAADPAGRLWIERNPASRGGPRLIDLVGTDGRYLGTLRGERLPQAFGSRGRIAYVEVAESGVQQVVVRQLSPPLR